MAVHAPQHSEDSVEFTFGAEEAEVRQVLRRAVARFARQITQADAGSLELTLAEVLNNVVEHSYAGQDRGLVYLSVRRNGDALVCQVEDFGCPMPNLSLPDGALPQEPQSIENLPEGGWGWALIRAMTTNLDYARIADKNRLSFCVPLESEQQAATA
ncbi:MAG: ATP-binding protein [Paracoccaceae bacterium]